MASKLPGLISVSRLVSPLSTSSCMPVQQRRTIVREAFLKLPEDYPDPWPYKEKGYEL